MLVKKPIWFSFLGVLIGLLFLSACIPTSVPTTPTATPDTHEVQLPAVGAGTDQEPDPLPSEPEEPVTADQPQPAVDYPEPVDATVATEAPYPYPDPADAVIATAEPYPDPQPTTMVQPTPRVDMEATDPAMVSLASGRVQLVEFFAFW